MGQDFERGCGCAILAVVCGLVAVLAIGLLTGHDLFEMLGRALGE